MAEKPPSTRPSRSAYKGAVSGAQFFLKMVTNAVTIPPIRPPIIQGRAACGSGECARPQVQAEDATTHSSSTPVLLTVPCSVIASPTATSPRNAFSFRAGLDVRNGLAIALLTRCKNQCTTWKKPLSNRRAKHAQDLSVVRIEAEEW